MDALFLSLEQVGGEGGNLTELVWEPDKLFCFWDAFWDLENPVNHLCVSVGVRIIDQEFSHSPVKTLLDDPVMVDSNGCKM